MMQPRIRIFEKSNVDKFSSFTADVSNDNDVAVASLPSSLTAQRVAS